MLGKRILKMLTEALLGGCALVLCLPALNVKALEGVEAPEFKVQYYDVTVADSGVYIHNPSVENPLLCEQIYVFDSHEEMQACCGCPVTEHGVLRISVKSDLLVTPLSTPAPTSGVVKVITTTANSTSGRFTPCNPAAVTGTVEPNPAWISHAQIAIGSPAGTQDEFQDAGLGSAELSALTSACTFIHTNGTKRGICACGASS